MDIFRNIKYVSLIATLSAVLAGCNNSEDSANATKPDPIRPLKVVTVDLTNTIIEKTYSAVVLPAQEVELSFRVSGKLVELPIRGGANVKEGDVIAQLDKRDFEAEITRLTSQLDQANAQMTALTSGARAEDVAALEASVAAVEAQVTAARDQLDRSEKLFKQKIVAKAKVEGDQTSLRVAEAELEAKKQELIKGKAGARAEDVAAQEAVIKGLQSNLKSLNDNLSDATLRAPFDGIIATRKVENFSNIQAKESIATLQALSTPNLIFDVPGPDVAVFAKIETLGLKVILDSIPGREFVAKRSEFSTQADAATQTYRGRVSIENPEADPILPGMTGALTVSAEQNSVAKLMVPLASVVSGADGSPFVWLVSQDTNKIAKNSVTIGSAVGSTIEVKSGLTKGDMIAVAGLSALQEDMLVKPVTVIGE